MKYKLPVVIKYLLSVFVTGIVFFTLFRVLLVVTNTSAIHSIPDAMCIMFRTMVMGLRFDTVISGYLLALPAVILVFAELLNLLTRRLLVYINVFICIVYSLGFLICAADIPFFNNYNNRLNVTILNWTSSTGTVAKMIWQDNIFLGYFALFVILSLVFALLLSRISKYYAALITDGKHKIKTGVGFRFGVPLIFFCFMFLGIRGRTELKTPIGVGTAYFSNYDFPNQAGLNPVFTFLKSWMEGMKDENKRLELMKDHAAIALTQSYLHIPNTALTKQYPLFRAIKSDIPQQKYNVVIVLMESMSAFYLQRFGNTMGLTPNLDTLAEKGYSFDNFYSAGIHTFNGIFSTLYSYPALMARHTLKNTIIPSYTGLPGFMHQRGYETIFFMTHDDQFDNVGGFLAGNHISRLFSKKDYPSSEIKSTWGVGDHYMFGFSMPVLNEYYNANRPFMAAFMTTSNHQPYVIPGNIPFKPRHTDIRGGCLEYADWSIGNFMQLAAKQPWFNNTIFVFTGDHGVKEGDFFGDLPFAYSRVPFIIYCPALLKEHKAFIAPGGQIDIFPTVAGLLGGDYTNNTLGIDLLHERRPWMFFSQDDKLCVADSSQLYIWHTSGTENMYSLITKQQISPMPHTTADSMKQYAFSMLQATQWALYHKATGSVKQ